MEFFLPSLFIFLLAVIVISFIVPRMSPVLIIGMSAILLGFGVYHHFKLFWDEYKQSTWQDQLRLFAPGIMLTVIIIYVLFSILMFFTGGSVPVPSMPNVELPSAETATNVVTEAINTIIAPLMPSNNVTKQANNNTTKQANNTSDTPNIKRDNNTRPANKNNNISRSFLATI